MRSVSKAEPIVDPNALCGNAAVGGKGRFPSSGVALGKDAISPGGYRVDKAQEDVYKSKASHDVFFQ